MNFHSVYTRLAIMAEQTPRSRARWATADDPHFVYEIRDTRGRLVYVGCTINPGRRLATHASGSWWHQAADIRIARFPDRASAQRRELELIHEHMPPHNVQGIPWEVIAQRLEAAGLGA